MKQSKILEYIEQYNLKNEKKRLKKENSIYRADDVYEIASIHSLATLDEDFKYGEKPVGTVEDFINEIFAKFRKDYRLPNSATKKYPYYDFSKNCLEIIFIKYFRIKNDKREDPLWQVMYLFGKDEQGDDIYFYSNEYAWKEIIPNSFHPREALNSLPTQIVDYLQDSGILDKVALPAKDLSKEFLEYIDFYYQLETERNLYDSFFINCLDINDLVTMSDDNPWKKYEGLSVENFVVENFKSIKKEAPIFTDTISKMVIEICFLKLFNKELKRDYWFCVYFFGEGEDGNPKYMVGGEPEKETPTNSKLKENGWDEFPEDIRKFWSIHGIFVTDLVGYHDDFDLSNLSQLYIEHQEAGNLPHYATLIKTNDYMSDDVCINMEHPNNYNSQIESWEENEEEYIIFAQEYLRKGIILLNNCCIVKSYKGLPQYFNMPHWEASYFYNSFWDMLMGEIEVELKEI